MEIQQLISTQFFTLQPDVFIQALALLLLIVWSGLWLLHLVALVYSQYRLYRRPKLRSEGLLPGVSIIKPLVGVDPNLAVNLESFFTMKYELYELLFCVHNEIDSALMVVKMLMNKYKHIDAKIFIGGEFVGLNPKINNMMPAYRSAKYNRVMISDSCIFMREESLIDMIESMHENVAMVTQVPYCMDRKGFAARLEQLYFGTSHSRMYLAGNCLRVVCSTGMSSLMLKSVLDEAGGLQYFGPYLAEDYFIGCAFVSKGWRCVISSFPALQNGGSTTARKFHDRICRWMKLRISMLPHLIILEPLQDCILAGLVASWAANFLLQWNSLIFFLVHILAWMLLDYLLISIIQNDRLPFGKFEFAVLWLYRELSALPTFLRALFEPDIIWRSGTYRLRWGGLIKPIIKS